MLLDRLFDNLALTVDPFAACSVADGWRLRLPGRDWVTLHFAVDGDGELSLGSGEVFALTRNWLAIIPAGLVHSLQCNPVCNEAGIEGQGDAGSPLCEFLAGPPDRLRLIVACGRVQASYAGGMGLFDRLREAIVLDFGDAPQMRSIFEALIDEYRRSGPASVAMMNALMNQCLIQVLRRVSQEAEGALPWLSALDDPRLSRVVDAILRHPEQSHTLESLASIANMSRSAFTRHFGECFGRTPMDYVREVRLRRAAQMLRGDRISIEGIASKVGFASRSHFSHAFRDQFGISPKDFREQRI